MDQFLEEGLSLAEQMGHDQFKASNGWLECFKKRHNIRQFAVSGEEADVAIPKSIINGSIQIDGTDFTASVKTIRQPSGELRRHWDEVKPQTIINCFRKTGALPEDRASEEDPFADLEEDYTCQEELVHQLIQTQLQMSI